MTTQEEPHFASVERGINGYLTRHNLAVVYMNMGRLAEAEEQLRLAVAETLRFRPALYALAEVLLRQGKHSAAETLVEQLGSHDDLRSEALFIKGQLDAAHGDRAASHSDLEAAIHLRPDDLELLKMICKFLCDRGDAAEAKEFLESLVVRDPKDASAHHNLGTLCLQRREFARAAELLRESLRFRPDHPTTLLNLGFALKEQGQRDEAIATFFRVVQVAPHHPSAVQAKRELDMIAAK